MVLMHITVSTFLELLVQSQRFVGCKEMAAALLCIVDDGCMHSAAPTLHCNKRLHACANTQMLKLM